MTLTPKQRREIFDARGTLSQRELANMYLVSQATISNIHKGDCFSGFWSSDDLTELRKGLVRSAMSVLGNKDENSREVIFGTAVMAAWRFGRCHTLALTQITGLHPSLTMKVVENMRINGVLDEHGRLIVDEESTRDERHASVEFVLHVMAAMNDVRRVGKEDVIGKR